MASRVGSMRPQDPRLRRALQVSVGLVVVLSVALAALATAGDLHGLDFRWRPLSLIAGVAGIAVFTLAAIEIWRRQLSLLGADLPRRAAMAVWLTSTLGRYVPTGVMLPMLRMAMAEPLGVPKRVSLAALVYESALFLTAAVIVGAYSVVRLPDLQGAPLRYVILVLPLLAIVALQPRVFHTVADALLTRLGRERLPLSLSGRQVIAILACYLLIIPVAGIATYELAQLVYPLEVNDLLTVTGAFAASTVLSYLAFLVPGGLGAREVGMTVALTPIMPGGAALGVAVISRIAQISTEVVMALIARLVARRSADRSAVS